MRITVLSRVISSKTQAAEVIKNIRMLVENEVLPMKIKLEVVLDAIETADDAFTYGKWIG